MPKPRTIRAALAVVSRRGRYLICQRRTGAFLGGYWEFPGGKREPGESWEMCVRRELKEELGISVTALKPLAFLRHRYKAASITFKVFRCRLAHGIPRPLGAQALRWVTPNQLRRYRFPPANRVLLAKLSRRLSMAQRRGIIVSPTEGG